MDEITNSNTNTHSIWPGDLGGSFSNWTHALVEESGFSTNDLCKLLSAPGKFVPLHRIPTANTNGVLVYAVGMKSEDSTVFLTSANFTNTPTGGLPFKSSAQPYGNKGFVVFRKGGDGALLSPKQTGKTNIIGTFAPLCR